MSDQGENQPITLDITDGVLRDSSTVQEVLDKEKAERLQAVAERLGGFSVAVIAESGDPYQTIYSNEKQMKVISPVANVPEGMVIVSMRNTAHPQTPTDLSRLLDAERKEAGAS